jgi:hypothetical protein
LISNLMLIVQIALPMWLWNDLLAAATGNLFTLDL